MNLPKHDQALLDGFAKRYAQSGTLMAGVMYEATWGIREAREWWNDLLEDAHEIAWVSDPRLVGLEPAKHIIALGPSGDTVDASGRRDRGSGLNCARDAERSRSAGSGRWTSGRPRRACRAAFALR